MTQDKLTAILANPSLDEGCVEALYDAWAAARDEALVAYRVWCLAPEDEKADAHAVYVAAADREAAAADVFMSAQRGDGAARDDAGQVSPIGTAAGE